MKKMIYVLGMCIVLNILVVSNTALAYVNPNFTPYHVEEQAKLMCTVTVKSIAADSTKAELAVRDIIKGKLSEKVLNVDFATVLKKEDGKDIADEVIRLFKESGSKPALFAYGGPEGEEFVFMHIACTWVRLDKGGSMADWVLTGPDTSLNGTFNGGTDMLIATMRFIRKFPSIPVMPVSADVEWSFHEKAGTLPGTAAGIAAVDINADGKLDIFAASLKGDMVCIRADEGFEQKTLPSKSKAFAWADFDMNGKPDLASLESHSLTLYLQSSDGQFSSRTVKLKQEIKTKNPSLWVIDLRGDGIPDIVAGTGMPLLFSNNGKGELTNAKLPDSAGEGKPGPCVVSDFNNDGIHDIVQIFQKNGLVYTGLPSGDFKVSLNPEAGMGNVETRQECTADLNGDGLIDILLTGGGRTPLLLENTKGAFREVMRYTGEASYIIQASAECSALGDFNNDTFVDIFAGYPEEGCQFFFNRGFRSFAICEPLKFREDEVQGASEGQQAAVWGDFDGNGSIDLAVVLSNNDVYVSTSNLGEMYDPLSLCVALDRKAKCAGPVIIRFYMEGHSLGARTASKWHGPALMGISEPGEYVMEYQLPNTQPVKKKVIAEDGKKLIIIGK